MKKNLMYQFRRGSKRLCRNSISLFRILFFTFLCLLISMSTLMAQTQTVSGIVRDPQGEPFPGVTVVIKGTTTGVITDMDGRYSLPNVMQGATLAFSFIGMTSQEIVVGNQTTINVILESSFIDLDEVVAIGYVTRKKGEITGSISTINSEALERTSSKDLEKSLSGKIPGLIVSDKGGYPGVSDVTLLIRGKSTLNNNEPLILIDGITAGSFSHLSPQDIESLTVLKDGAAAIYGARAANGVILIATKRGKVGKPKVNFSSSYNVSSFSATPKLTNSAEFATWYNEAADRENQKLPYTQEDINKYAAGNDPNYPNTNWADETFADYSPELRTSLSVSGGTDAVNYFVSGDYMDQVGMYKSGDLNFKQYQLRSNLDIKIYDNFKLGVDLSGRFGDVNEPGVNDSYIYKHIYANEPTEVAIYPNGLPAWGGENGANPYIMSSSKSGFVNKMDNDLRAKFSFDWKLDKIVSGLSANGFAGIRKMSNDEKSWYTPWPYYQYQEGTDEYVESFGYSQRGNERILRESFWKFNELMLNATLHYSKIINNVHSLSGFVGVEQMSSNQRNFWVEKKGFPTKDHSELFAGSDEGQQSKGVSAEWGRMNYFGSLSYDFRKKYFLDFTIRYDGSSNFGEGNRFGSFPGVAVSWALADELFMNWSDSWLDAFKIRASWALMGNDRIGAFQYLTRYNYSGPTLSAQPNYYFFGSPAVRYNGYVSSNVPNPNITWETADMKNVGVNFLVLNRRLSGDINYFYQKREDILVTRNASIPDFAGLTLPQENLGKVDNFGWEFELGWNDKVGQVNYHLGANLTQAKNEVVYMDEPDDVPEWRRREGYPMDSYIVYPTAGIFKDQEQLNNTLVKKPGTVEGEPIYLDTDGSGRIDANDRVRSYYSDIPEIQYGIYGGFDYKGLNLNFLFQGQAEAKIFAYFEGKGAFPTFMYDGRWTPENRDARYPRAFLMGDNYSGNLGEPDNFEGADFWLHDASFLRLKELELGYTFSQDKIKFGSLKLYVRGYNLLTMFSDIYDMGLDPESTGYVDFRKSKYPSLKTYTVGLNLNF